MKVLICGSRGINDRAVVAHAVAASGMAPTHIVSGGARGIDTLARLYAQTNDIEFTEYVADWDKHGRRAGFLRNVTMVVAVEAVIAVWDGKSRGTKHSIDYATSQGKQVFVLRPNKQSGWQETAR